MKVLILPGLDGTGALHRGITTALRPYRATVLTYPHHVVDYAQAIDHVARHLPNEPFVLVAESFSGPVALAIANTKPPHLHGVVFAASFTASPRRIPAILAPVVRLVPPHRVARLIQPLIMGRWADAAFLADFKAALKVVPSAVLAQRLAAVLRLGPECSPTDWQVPVMALAARHDRLVPPRAIADIPVCQMIDGPHFLLQANPNGTAKAILDFIQTDIGALA